jgi:hypothetical protein
MPIIIKLSQQQPAIQSVAILVRAKMYRWESKRCILRSYSISHVTGHTLFRTLRLPRRDRKISRVLKTLISTYTLICILRCDQLKNKSSRRVTYGNPCYSTGSKANSIYFLNDRSVLFYQRRRRFYLCIRHSNNSVFPASDQ